MNSRLNELIARIAAGRVRRIGRLIGLVISLHLATVSFGQVASVRVTLTDMAHVSLIEGPQKTALSNAVSALEFSPDGATLAVGLNAPYLVMLLNPSTLAVTARFEGHLKLVSKLAFTPDGRTLVSSGHDGSVRLWDVASKRQRLLIDQFQGNIRGLAMSPDGKRIFTGESARLQGTAKAWDTQDGRLLAALPDYDHGINDLALSSDGQTLVTGSNDQTLRLWDVATLQQKDVFDAKGPKPNRVAYSADGQSLFAVFDDMSLRSFDLAPLRPRYKIETKAEAFPMLALSPDGSIVATSDVNRLRLWRSSDGSALTSVADVGSQINAIRFSPDGKSVVVGGLAGLVRVYRLDRADH